MPRDLPTPPYGPFTDKLGKELKVGQRIVFATRAGTTARLSFGTIKMIDPLVKNTSGRSTYHEVIRESHLTKKDPTGYYLPPDRDKQAVLVVENEAGGTSTLMHLRNVAVLES